MADKTMTEDRLMNFCKTAVFGYCGFLFFLNSVSIIKIKLTKFIFLPYHNYQKHDFYHKYT